MNNTDQHHPPDRSGIVTEQRNPRSAQLHELSVAGCIDLLCDEDTHVLAAIRAARPALTSFVSDACPRFATGGRLIYIGAGTSGRLGVLDASEAPPTFQVTPDRVIGIIAGGDGALRKSSEGLEDVRDGAREELAALHLTGNDTVLGITTGGTTPYVLGALDLARSLEPQVLVGLFVCAPVPKPPAVDHMLVIETGPEIITGSTRMKAGTATKIVLNMISTTLMVQSGRVYGNLMVDVKATNDKLRDRAARIVSTLTDLPRDAAFRLLDEADGEVKTAVVMHARGVKSEAARNLLSAADGFLHFALQDASV